MLVLVLGCILCQVAASSVDDGAAAAVSTVQGVLQQALQQAQLVLQSQGSSALPPGVGAPHIPQKSLSANALASFPSASRALEELDEIYRGRALDAFYVDRGHESPLDAFSQVGAHLGSSADAAYGELLPISVIEMLSYLGARPGHRYYDLGSGTGKTAVLAWLLGLNASGIEMARSRYLTACSALERAAEGKRELRVGSMSGEILSFYTGNLLELDFTDADIIFVNSPLFSDEVMQSLSCVARRMRPGAVVISFQGLRGAGFQAAGTFTGLASWGLDTNWVVQVIAPEYGDAEVSESGSVESCPAPVIMHDFCSL